MLKAAIKPRSRESGGRWLMPAGGDRQHSLTRRKAGFSLRESERVRPPSQRARAKCGSGDERVELGGVRGAPQS